MAGADCDDHSMPGHKPKNTCPDYLKTEPFPGKGQKYKAPPPPLIKPKYGEYIQPWNGYVPECTRKDKAVCKYLPAQTSNIKTTIYDGIEVQTNKWMTLACEEAVKSVQCGGGPFGGVIVQIDDETNEVIRYWVQHNHVPQENDPTAHAEMSVVRDACRSLGVLNLGRITKEESRLPQKGLTSHCEIYSAAEPCPMCYSAIYWARIPVLYFAATRYDAAQQGVDFSDQPLYDDICLPYRERKIKTYQCTTDNSLDAFNLWKRSEKRQY
jgi:tRNA(Arg) A34 adenosine deaminase TadA